MFLRILVCSFLAFSLFSCNTFDSMPLTDYEDKKSSAFIRSQNIYLVNKEIKAGSLYIFFTHAIDISHDKKYDLHLRWISYDTVRNFYPHDNKMDILLDGSNIIKLSSSIPPKTTKYYVDPKSAIEEEVVYSLSLEEMTMMHHAKKIEIVSYGQRRNLNGKLGVVYSRRFKKFCENN